MWGEQIFWKLFWINLFIWKNSKEFLVICMLSKITFRNINLCLPEHMKHQNYYQAVWLCYRGVVPQPLTHENLWETRVSRKQFADQNCKNLESYESCVLGGKSKFQIPPQQL